MAFLSPARPSRLEPRGRNRSLVEMAGDHRVRTESRKHTRVAEGGGVPATCRMHAERTQKAPTPPRSLTHARILASTRLGPRREDEKEQNGLAQRLAVHGLLSVLRSAPGPGAGFLPSLGCLGAG